MFEKGKKRAMEKLKIRGADEEIKNILERINSSDFFYTTSSCSGRISLLLIPEIGSKREAKFLGKWHGTPNVEEVMELIKKPEKGEVWLIYQSPILHVVCRDTKRAIELLRKAYSSGFKYSSIKGISEERVIVEILSTERMHVPLGKDGFLFCNEEYLNFILERADIMLSRGKEKLKRFYSTISSP
ncbi:MAG: tRNA(Phe) 7-((3-amino-3-carboxypropyl)-4-demethylwyosine(37)-N(4))-methyltransferase [Candidatus Syntropharchaeia archaeon]